MLQYIEETDVLLVGLSHKVRHFGELDIQITGGESEDSGEAGGREIQFDVARVAERGLDASIASTW